MPQNGDTRLCAARFGAVKDTSKFLGQAASLLLDSAFYKRIFLDMLHEHSRRTAWQDWKQDNWVTQVAFGLFLAALVVWLVILYRGYPLAF
jgi:hypothetical protein